MSNTPAETLTHWQPPPVPNELTLDGHHIALYPLTSAHTDDLLHAFSLDKQQKNWHYLPYGPFTEPAALEKWIKEMTQGSDPYFFAIEKKESKQFCGVASYLRIKPHQGSIEVGHIHFSPLLQHTTAATEAMFLMMQWVFESGYRRYEWKCNALNKASRSAAQRLGFSYEGIFRQAAIVKGRNRDTAWLAVIDKEWQTLKACFTAYLQPSNFTDEGKQITSLRSLTAPILYQQDPLFINQ